MIEFLFERLEMYPRYGVGPNVLWFCTWHDIYVEFPVWIDSKCAVEEFCELLQDSAYVVSLRLAEVSELLGNVIHVHFFVFGI